LKHRLIRAIGYHLVKAYASLLLKLDAVWRQPLPAGPKIFVANHPSATDPFLIHLVSKQPMSVLISANAFLAPILGPYLRRIEQVPVTPGEGAQAMEHARRLLLAGRSVGIFPEGDFSPQEGGMREPRTGAARLALATGAAVVPVGIYIKREWSYRIVSGVSGKRTVGYWYLHGPYTVTVGEPMQFRGDEEDRQRVREVSASIMENIGMLAAESESRWRKANRAYPLNDFIIWLRTLLGKRRTTTAW